MERLGLFVEGARGEGGEEVEAVAEPQTEKKENHCDEEESYQHQLRWRSYCWANVLPLLVLSDAHMTAFTGAGGDLNGEDFSTAYDCSGKSSTILSRVEAVGAVCCCHGASILEFTIQI